MLNASRLFQSAVDELSMVVHVASDWQANVLSGCFNKHQGQCRYHEYNMAQHLLLTPGAYQPYVRL